MAPLKKTPGLYENKKLKNKKKYSTSCSLLPVYPNDSHFADSW